MADFVPVNSQVTDAVTQVNVKVLAEAPAMAMGHVFQTMAHSTGIMFENAVAAQQQMTMAAQAATVQGVNLLYTVPTSEDAVASSKINRSDLAEVILGLRSAFQATQPTPTPTPTPTPQRAVVLTVNEKTNVAG